MNHVWDAIALAVVGFMWGPADRTVTAWANVTHRSHR